MGRTELLCVSFLKEIKITVSLLKFFSPLLPLKFRVASVLLFLSLVLPTVDISCEWSHALWPSFVAGFIALACCQGSYASCSSMKWYFLC